MDDPQAPTDPTFHSVDLGYTTELWVAFGSANLHDPSRALFTGLLMPESKWPLTIAAVVKT